MKYLKHFSKFESSTNEDSEIFDEVVDIFSYLSDYNLYVSDVYKGNALSIGSNQVVIDHNDFSSNDIFKSITVRLKPKIKDEFLLMDEAFDELRSAIGHVGSYLDLELMHIYLRTLSGVWFDSVDSLEKYINDLPFAKKKGLKYTIYLDITFKDLEEIKESKKWEIEYHLDDILDMFREYADEYDLKYVDNFDNLQEWHSGDLDNCYALRFPSKSSWCASIDILFDDYFGSAGVEGYLGEDFQMDMREFIRRLESLNLECEIDWSGGSSYTIDIYSK